MVAKDRAKYTLEEAWFIEDRRPLLWKACGISLLLAALGGIAAYFLFSRQVLVWGIIGAGFTYLWAAIFVWELVRDAINIGEEYGERTKADQIFGRETHRKARQL